MLKPAPKTGRKAATVTREKIRILICDDEKLILTIISRILTSANYEVVTTTSPVEGIAAFKSGSFAAVITDVMMEPVDGFIFREMIRACNKTIPIVFLTSLIGGSDHYLLNMITQDPCSYFIPKQSGKLLLLNKLDQILMAYRTERAQNFAQNRLREELALASNIQRAMLPPYVYSGNCFEYSCLYRPLHKISGDLYERLPITDSRGIMVFGDLSGHGIHSALAMIAVQSFLKSIDLDQENLPCTLARKLNGFLWRQLHGIAYMCALIVFYDFEKNIMRYYNSGMGDLLCVNSRTGKLRDLNPEKRGSLPLGMMPDGDFEQSDTVEAVFDDGEYFIAASDGISDLSMSPDGTEGLDMALFRELLGQAVIQSRELGDIVALPFQIYSMLELAGYAFPQDDTMLMVMRKKTHPRRGVLYYGSIRCLHEEVDRLVQQVAETVNTRFAPCIELAVSVELMLQEHLTNILNHGFDGRDHDGEYIFVKVVDAGRNLIVTVWDFGREWRFDTSVMRDPDKHLDMLNDSGAVNGRGVAIIQKIASRISRKRLAGLNECTFVIPQITESASK